MEDEGGVWRAVDGRGGTGLQPERGRMACNGGLDRRRPPAKAWEREPGPRFGGVEKRRWNLFRRGRVR